MRSLGSILIVLLFVACKKYVPGPQGDAGKNGQNGNSNISKTVAFTIAPAAWDSLVVEDEWFWEHKVTVSEISQSVLKSGDVMVYKQIGNEWYPLPTFEGYLCTQYSLTESQVKLKLTHLHSAIPPRPAAANYRVVVLSPK